MTATTPKKLTFAATVFLTSNVVMYVMMIGQQMFDPHDGAVPYVLAFAMTIALGFFSWWLAKRLYRQ